MRSSKENPSKSSTTDKEEQGHYQKMPKPDAFKTNETILDGGNMEDYNGSLSDSDSPLLEKNIADDNLSRDKAK